MGNRVIAELEQAEELFLRQWAGYRKGLRYNKMIVNLPSIATGEQLANALHALGVKFIMGGSRGDESLHKQPARLIAALAESNESRLRLSLIPLFLEHPEFSAHVRMAARGVNPAARLILQCYYTAAVWLQRKHRPRLALLIGRKASLPDYFSSELGFAEHRRSHHQLTAACPAPSHIEWSTYQLAGHI